MSANAYPLIQQMASDSAGILIAGCDYTDERLSEAPSRLSFFFLLVGVEVEGLGAPFCSVLLPIVCHFGGGGGGGGGGLRVKKET